MKPSHTIESTVEAWAVIEAAPAVRALFVEGTPWCWWCSNKALIVVLDSNALAAAHVLSELQRAQPEDVSAQLRHIADECRGIVEASEKV